MTDKPKPGAFDWLAEELSELRRELNLAIGNGHEELRQIEARIEQLEDAVNWHDGANMENATAPNIPEPPVDTEWRSYNPGVASIYQLPCAADARVVALTRGGQMLRAQRALVIDWTECEDATIVAWRYAKEGE